MNMEFFRGKKTFIAVGVFVIVAAVSLLFSVAIPEWAWTILAAFGLGFIRSAMTDISGNSGWKTYVAVVAAGGLGTVQAFGLTIPPDVLTGIYAVLGTFGVVGVRDALAKINK